MITQYVDIESYESHASDQSTMATILIHPYFAESPERKALEPMFIFVYGLNFEDMKSRKPDNRRGSKESLGDTGNKQNSWSAKDLKRQWQEPRRKKRRCVGRASGEHGR